MTSDAFLEALQRRGVRRIRRVRFRDNRQVLLSISRDGAGLNAHRCFLDAPPRVLDDVATFVTASRRTEAYRAALWRIQHWPGALKGLRAAQRRAIQRAAEQRAARSGDDGTSREHRRLYVLYDRLNEQKFSGRLPRVAVRISRRMKRRYGQVQLHHNGRGERIVLELAVNAVLLDDGNAGDLEDTLLHEMAHVEAWLRHGDRSHGPVWKRIAERVGADARARAPRQPRSARRPRAARRRRTGGVRMAAKRR